jgi:hypothetical protein
VYISVYREFVCGKAESEPQKASHLWPYRTLMISPFCVPSFAAQMLEQQQLQVPEVRHQYPGTHKPYNTDHVSFY